MKLEIVFRIGYSEPRIMQVKDGASWSALEYAKWAQQNKTHKKPLIIVPAGIVYTNKAKYRSRVVVECVSLPNCVFKSSVQGSGFLSQIFKAHHFG